MAREGLDTVGTGGSNFGGPSSGAVSRSREGSDTAQYGVRDNLGRAPGHKFYGNPFRDGHFDANDPRDWRTLFSVHENDALINRIRRELKKFGIGRQSSIGNKQLQMIPASYRKTARSRVNRAKWKSAAPKGGGGGGARNPLSNVNWSKIKDRKAFDRWWSANRREMQQSNIGSTQAYNTWQGSRKPASSGKSAGAIKVGKKTMTYDRFMTAARGGIRNGQPVAKNQYNQLPSSLKKELGSYARSRGMKRAWK